MIVHKKNKNRNFKTSIHNIKTKHKEEKYTTPGGLAKPTSSPLFGVTTINQKLDAFFFFSFFRLVGLGPLGPTLASYF